MSGPADLREAEARDPQGASGEAHTADPLMSRSPCPDCGYHDGQHGENCTVTESELRAAWGDK